jgi:hypothetical protein
MFLNLQSDLIDQVWNKFLFLFNCYVIFLFNLLCNFYMQDLCKFQNLYSNKVERILSVPLKVMEILDLPLEKLSSRLCYCFKISHPSVPLL